MAALALAIATPVVASYAAPSFAAGDDATVMASINDDGDVEVESTKGLSRVTVVLCDGTVIVSDDWSADQKEGVVDVDGAVRAVFIHSGNNTTDAAEILLESLSPGAVNGNSTGAIAINDNAPCNQPEDEEEEEENGGGNNGGDNNTGGGNAGGPSENPSTTVLGVRLEEPSNPAAAPAALAPAAPAAAAPAPAVVGLTEVSGGELPRTGTAHVQFLVTLALSFLAAGLTLRAVLGRRTRSAFFPG